MIGISRAALVLLAALALLVGIDNLARPLANPDEGRYSEISREMAESGDWITPRLNGFKYFEKPPLQYWASAIAIKLLGANEYAARAYPGLCAVLVVLAIGFLMWKLAGVRPAILAVAVLLSSPYFVVMGGVVTLDMGLTAWLTVAVCAFLMSQAGSTDDRARRRWLWLAWAGMALAVLSKGLVGIVLPAATIFLYCLWHRDWALLKRLEWARGLVIFLTIAAPWFILVSIENAEFARFFFVHEHFTRFLTHEHRRVGTWWYFIPIFFLGVLPWMVAFVPAVISAWRREATAITFRWRRFAILWIGFVLVFFSVSGSKLPPYILPLFPMTAVVLAEWLDRTEPRRLALYIVPVAILLAVALAFGWGAPDRSRSEWTKTLYHAARPWIVGGGVVLITGYLIATLMLRRRLKDAAVAMVITVTLVFIDAVEDGYEELSPRQSGMEIAAIMRSHLTPETRVYAVRHYDQTATFYLGRTVTLVDYIDEFALGLEAEPSRGLPTVERFIDQWREPGPAMAIIQPGLEDRLRRERLEFSTLHADERRVVIRKAVGS